MPRSTDGLLSGDLLLPSVECMSLDVVVLLSVELSPKSCRWKSFNNKISPIRKTKICE